MAPRKVRRRPWSSAEKEAVWRQLGVHVLVQSVPGKEVCQRCLDLEPVLRGRHWKDIKNQVHNQIQSQKKQQFHTQMDLQENQDHQDQNQLDQQYQTHTDHQNKDQSQKTQLGQQDISLDKKKPQNHFQPNHQDQGHIQSQKKLQYLTRLDPEDPLQIHQKQLHYMDHQTQLDPAVLTGTSYGSAGPHRDSGISLYPVPHRTLGPHTDQTRTSWTELALTQHFRNLDPGGAADPGSVHL